MYERLLKLGYTEQMAQDVLTLFPDPTELKKYVLFTEMLYV